MPSHASTVSSSSAIPAMRNSQIQNTCTAHQYVGRYTEMLVTGTNRLHALQRLLQVDCSIRVFEDCSTETVLKKYVSNIPQYNYQVTRLTQKFADLRRNEIKKAHQRLETNGELTAHISFTSEFVEIQKTMMEQKSQGETNKLFATAMTFIKKDETSKTPKVKVDYSKYKITKRSKSTSLSSSSSVSPS